MRFLIFLTVLFSFSVHAQSFTLDRNTAPNVVYSILGYASGLVSHEFGHYAVANYTGGKFVEFSPPYGPLGEPTMYFNGSRSQMGMTAMAGNNLSLFLASRKLFPSESDLFSVGFNYFHILNPIGYFLKGSGDLEFASNEFGISKDKLRLMVAIPSMQNLLNQITSIGTTGSIQASVIGSHLKYEFTGPINTRQSYVGYEDNNISVDLSIGADIDEYSVYYGELTHTLDDIKESPYISIVKSFKGEYGSTSIEYKKLFSENDSYSISHDYNGISLGYDKYQGTNLSIKYSF